MRSRNRFVGLRPAFSLPRTVRSLGRDVDEEIRFHIESRVAELVEQGLSPTEARERALRQYGDLTASREELMRVDRNRLARDRWTVWADAVVQDIAFSLRVFRNRPAFALASTFVLALGIGANASMFGVIDRLLLRAPSGIVDPATVMQGRYLRTDRGVESAQDSFSFPMYLDLLATRGAFSDVAAYAGATLAVGRGADARSVQGMKVTASYFRTLGVRPRLGRFFTADDDGSPTAPNVVVVSYEYWRREFGGDPGALGRTLPIGDARFTVVGVAPPGFSGVDFDRVDMWLPLTAGVSPAEFDGWKHSRTGFWLLTVMRIAPGSTRAASAAAATRTLQASMRADGVSDERVAEQRPSIGFVSELPSEARAGDTSARVAALLGAVSLLVMLIACANVANLQLARGISRRREIAVRIALGVSRRRLLAQLLIESVVLALAGGACALGVAYWGGAFVRRVLLGSSDLAGASAIDGRVLAYTAGASIAAGILSGLVPALHAGRASIATELKDGVRDSGARRTRARTLLLLVQTALSVVLLVGAGLFVRSLRKIDALPLGLEPDRVLVTTLSTQGTSYTSRDIAQMYSRLLDAAQGAPEVSSAALASSLPFYTSWAVRVRIPGRDSIPRVSDGGPYINEVTPDYFKTVGTRVLRGRGFTTSDQQSSPRVVVVNESMARLWWPGEDPIGKCLLIGGDTLPCVQVVGIAESARRQTIIESTSLQYFIPLSQRVNVNASPILLIRPRADASAATLAVRRRLSAAIPNLPYMSMSPLEDLVSPQKRSWSLGATMFAVLGGLALLLTAVGLYSVLAYDVTQRTREFGVRVAMGARSADVMRLVLGRGVRTALVGGAAGVLAALASGRLVAPLLFQTSPRDPAVLGLSLVIVVAVGLVAATIPARRALAVDPIEALRAE
ncbi:MAG: ADOP family duplicated permease [Gemmatimonadaceae bacterium]